MDEERDQVTVADMEDLIRKLPTVMGCAVAINDWGAVEEIHVLATLERSPKQVVRDVESALLARWGLRIDHKRVSVAQVNNDTPDVAAGRLAISEYQVELDTVQNLVAARVVLHFAGDRETPYIGEWKGRYVPSQYYHVTAWAAVEAVNHVPGVAHPFVLADLKPFSLADGTVVTVAVSSYNARQREEILIGAAPDRGEGQGTSVRAVLDAVNRRIGSFLDPHH
ncbi:MAG: hypothetical protein M0Z53_09910 [Thermaerobacter sp.]|nr:hypothetical protein [Thermaerobacter sp.]